MTFEELRTKAKEYPIFTLADILKWFPQTSLKTLLNQISFWKKKGKIKILKKGLYFLSDYSLEEPFLLANLLSSPSYISLESALNYYSIIPDIPFSVTSVTVKKTAKFVIKGVGRYTFRHLKSDLFFGYKTIYLKNYCYNIAFPEKALVDFLYLKSREPQFENFEGFIKEQRFFLEKDFSWRKFKEYCKLVSPKNKKFAKLKEVLIKKYAK